METTSEKDKQEGGKLFNFPTNRDESQTKRGNKKISLSNFLLIFISVAIVANISISIFSISISNNSNNVESFNGGKEGNILDKHKELIGHNDKVTDIPREPGSNINCIDKEELEKYIKKQPDCCENK